MLLPLSHNSIAESTVCALSLHSHADLELSFSYRYNRSVQCLPIGHRVRELLKTAMQCVFGKYTERFSVFFKLFLELLNSHLRLFDECWWSVNCD